MYEKQNEGRADQPMSEKDRAELKFRLLELAASRLHLESDEFLAAEDRRKVRQYEPKAVVDAAEIMYAFILK